MFLFFQRDRDRDRDRERERERENENESMSMGEESRGGENGNQVPGSVQSPMRGLISQP